MMLQKYYQCMQIISVTLLLLVLAVSCVTPVSLVETYAHKTTLTADFDLFWNVSDSSIISFALSGKTHGWMGIGFSYDGGLTGSDMILAYFNTTSNTTIVDDAIVYSGRKIVLDIDNQGTNDVVAVNGYKTNERTVVEFHRALSTGDMNDMQLIAKNPIHLVLVYSDTAPISPSSYSDYIYLGSFIINEPSDLPFNDTNVKVIDASFDRARVPTAYGVNMCLGFNTMQLIAQQYPDTADLAQKFHAIHFEPVIQNPDLVRRMILYRCNHEVNEMLKVNTTKSPLEPVECESMQEHCYQIMMIWTPGSARSVIPSEAGFPIGPTGALYLGLEIQYENTNQIDGIIDSSGFDIYYTPSVRRLDADVLVLGRFEALFTKDSSAYVSSDCSCAEQFPQPVTVFANLLHTTSLGSAVVTEHYDKNAKLVGSIGNSTNYDAAQESIETIQPYIQVKPSDELITECKYSTSSLDYQYCVNYLFYFPAMPSKKDCQIYERGRIPEKICTRNRDHSKDMDLSKRRAALAIVVIVIIIAALTCLAGVLFYILKQKYYNRAQKSKGNKLQDEDVVEMRAMPIDHAPDSSIHIDHFDDDLHL